VSLERQRFDFALPLPLGEGRGEGAKLSETASILTDSSGREAQPHDQKEKLFHSKVKSLTLTLSQRERDYQSRAGQKRMKAAHNLPT
jgi:hypothetical protein